MNVLKALCRLVFYNINHNKIDVGSYLFDIVYPTVVVILCGSLL